MAQSVKQAIIKGTFILTVAGILTKLLGFFNRIFLASTIGAREIGVYQLIFPVYLIVHCICCQGFEMGIMKYVAEESAFGHRENVKRYLRVSFYLSFALSLLLMVIVLLFHDVIASVLLKQPACSDCLFIMAFAFPLISIKDCILSYYYGKKMTGIPAASQLIEQTVRVTVIWALASVILIISKDATLATVGLVAGEAASLLFALATLPFLKADLQKTSLIRSYPQKERKHPAVSDEEYTGRKYHTHSIANRNLSYHTVLCNILRYDIPIIGTRLLLTILSSIESILIPYLLAKTLGSEDQALSLYGVLTGMALTFILFPSALTNSVAMMLLPTISEAKAKSQQLKVTKAATLSLHYCLLLGILCTAIFLVFGKDLGAVLFHDRTAGEFIFILSWLCPFIYIATTYTSILNGLGKTKVTFDNNVITALLRILSIVALIPRMGIFGYLIGLLVSYALLALFCVYHVHQEAGVHFNARRSILSPVCLAFLSITFAYITEFFLLKTGLSMGLLTLTISIAVLTGIYLLGVLILRLHRV